MIAPPVARMLVGKLSLIKNSAAEYGPMTRAMLLSNVVKAAERDLAASIHHF